MEKFWSEIAIVLSGVLGYFLKDLYSRIKKDSESIAELRAAFAPIGELKSTISDLRDQIHRLELVIASMTSNFVGRGEFNDSSTAINKRLDELSERVLTGANKRVAP